MQIAAQQMARINEGFLDDYVRETAAYLAAAYPEWVEGHAPDTASSYIHAGIRRAGRYNLDAKKEVTAYLEYSIRYGVDFEKRPEHVWAAKILRVTNIHGSEKLQRMLEQRPL